MKRLLSLALCFVLLPVAAGAQSPPMHGPTPSPAMRATMDKMKADRAALYAALMPEHRAAVETIIGQLATGKIASHQDAAKQIDALLTPDEKTAVMAAHTKMQGDMRSMMHRPGTPARSPRPRPSGMPALTAGGILLGVSHMGGGRGGPGGFRGRGHGHFGPPSPAMRAAMEKAHAAAKASALAALSASHRASVQSIVAQLAANKSTDRRAAGKAAVTKIDTLLTSSEKTAVLAVATKMMTSMRAAMKSSMAGHMGGPPNGMHRPGPPNGGAHRSPDAGRVLLMLLAPPKMMHGGPRGGMHGGPPGGH